MEIKTKYSIGDKVYAATMTRHAKQAPCPDCKDQKKWEVTSPGGGAYTFACPRCAASYRSRHDMTLQYTEYVGEVRELTIGSIRYDSHTPPEEPTATKYMCVETGVGSGQLWQESDLFELEQLAQSVANARARERTESEPRTVLLRDAALSVSDYQLNDDLPYKRKCGRLMGFLRELVCDEGLVFSDRSITVRDDEYDDLDLECWKRDVLRALEVL